ncbi:hypothetical protein ACS0TY_029158 [Phlomoides rotata]
MEKKKLGVRKGAWTKEEDALLRNCIHKFGEGKWHKVPHRAGLNRCRKSCRLRWLNYLRPNIKRGYFTKDEVDLILRLHKLLGNRWSLIAGRLPGRTANDVKNFWNTHILKKSSSSSLAGKNMEKTVETKTSIEKSIIIKPRPRTFSKSDAPVQSTEDDNKINKTKDEHSGNNKPSSSASLSQFPLINNVPFSLSEEEMDECIRCWFETAGNGGELTPVSFSDKITEFNSLEIDADVWDFANFD